MANDLKTKAVSSVFWTAVQKYTLMGVAFISSIILARLLTPYDYGCIGMLEIFITIATFLIDGGFGSALLQKKQPTDEDYSTIFYWNLIMSSILYVLLFYAAPYIASFYGIPLLSKVLRVQGVVLFINAFKMVQSNQLRKQFRFKPFAITNVVASLVSLVITIVMAYCGLGVWSLVAQNLIISAIPMVIFWMITKWKPLPSFSMQSFKELFKFGGFMFLTDIINTIADNIQGLLIGKKYNPDVMGYYAKAKSTQNLASNSIAQVVSMITYQLYAEVQDDKEMLKNIIKRITKTLSFVTFPILMILMIQAKPIFILLYSDRWIDSVPYFQVLCFAGFALCLQSITQQSIAAIGKSGIMFKWTFVNRSIGIGLIIGGLYLFGIEGLLVGMVLSSWLNYIVYACLVAKHIGYKLHDQIYALFPSLTLTTISSLICYSINLFSPLSMYWTSIISTIVFIMVYVFISITVKLDSYYYCKSIVSSFMNRKINK